MTVSKANNGNLVLKKVDVNSLIEKMITIFKEQYKKHKFVFNKNSNILLSRLDEDKFQQIITNLLDNAGKYSKEGSTITITTGFCNNMIFIDVKDEGVGIKEEDFDKLFKKFSRLENHLTSTTQGNGLGLYITKQIVECMNGKITFTSEINKGTTFRVEFPVYNEEEALKCSQKS